MYCSNKLYRFILQDHSHTHLNWLYYFFPLIIKLIYLVVYVYVYITDCFSEFIEFLSRHHCFAANIQLFWVRRCGGANEFKCFDLMLMHLIFLIHCICQNKMINCNFLFSEKIRRRHIQKFDRNIIKKNTSIHLPLHTDVPKTVYRILSKNSWKYSQKECIFK